MRNWILILVISLCGSAVASEFHVAPGGSPEGDGSGTKPWDLATALAHPESVKPGATIWLHGGTYRGSFESVLKGTTDAPIILRQVPGERAIVSIEHRDRMAVGLVLRGEHARYQGFEVLCENPKRETAISGSWPKDMQRGSVTVQGSHVQVINLVMHDLGSGSGFWREGEGGEIYGCLIYNNGWIGPDRGHGHGIYAQNERGTKTIGDCLIFRQFGGGIHIYGSAKSSLRGFHLDGVVAFQNGRPGQTRDLLVGGSAPLDDILIENCMTHGSGLQIGYGGKAKNRSVIARNNYLVGGLKVQYPGTDYTLTGNTAIASAGMLTIQLREGQQPDGVKMNDNRYFKTDKQWNPFAIYAPEGNRAGDLSVLQSAGFDKDSSYSASAPTENRVFVRPNRYEPGRGHVIVYNWEKRNFVDVDLRKVLETGQRFRIVHARNFFGASVIEGVFDGKPVAIPMTPRKAIPPIGYEEEKSEMTDLEFGVFVVLPTE